MLAPRPTLLLSQPGLGPSMAGNNWRGLPKTGGAGEMLWMAYAPGGVKGISK